MSTRLRTTTSRYSAVARAYRLSWAPILLAFSEPLLERMRPLRGGLVVDLGAGTGTLAARIARDARTQVVALDAAEGMLREARGAKRVRVAADVTRVPLADGVAANVVSTFMLQHVPRPGKAFAEAARILRPAGAFGTATWGVAQREEGGPYAVMARALDRAGAGPDPVAQMASWHHLVDDPGKVEALARRAGFSSVEVWTRRGAYPWSPETFLAWATSLGPFSRRLATLEPAVRLRVLTAVARRLERLSERSLVWRPDVVYAVARR